MLTAEALADLVSKYNPKSNSAKIVDAYKYGQTKHEGQFRKSGEPYFTHPVSVAEILAEQRLDMPPSLQLCCMIQLKIQVQQNRILPGCSRTKYPNSLME